MITHHKYHFSACVLIAWAATAALGSDRPKVAILPFKNIGGPPKMAKARDLTIDPTGIPMLGKDQQGNTIFGTSSVQVDVYGETARSQLERVLVMWDDVDVIERQERMVLQRELDLNDSRQGNREERELFAKQHGVDFYVFGQIVSIDDEVLQYEGYGVPRKVERTTATIFVRVVHMAPERVVFSTEISGKAERITTPFRTSAGGDQHAKAIRRAVLNMVEAPEFRQSLTTRVNDAANSLSETRVSVVTVDFETTPSGSMVDLDGLHIGSTPISKILPLRSEHSVRVTKPGFKPWEGRIKVEEGSAVKIELEEEK